MLQLAPDTYRPKRVIQILSSSRSGSSLLHRLLSRCRGVTALAGEEEPYIKMSCNGYGFNSNNECLVPGQVTNHRLIRRLIQTELTTEQPWEWRLPLQFKGEMLSYLLDNIPGDGWIHTPKSWLKEHKIWGHYDGATACERQPFNRDVVYEMPPFIVPEINPYQGCGEGALYPTLLLKCPYNLYRPGVMEAIYPEAEFSYIILLRNPAATINGLIDGWNADYGFHKHLTPFGWWKFDLPPGWEQFVNEPIRKRAWFQWLSTNELLRNRIREYSCPGSTGFRHTARMSFETLVKDPSEAIKTVCWFLDLEPPIDTQLPSVMQTEPPKPYRWKRREKEILSLLNNTRSQDLIKELDYADQTAWI